MKSVAVFDLDGTLADCTHRLHYIQGDTKNWGAFFEDCRYDTLIANTAMVAIALQNAGHELWIVTGRSDVIAHETKQWLENHSIFCDKLLMRPDGDHRPDVELKKEMLLGALKNKPYQVNCVFEDRKTVVDMWRDTGFTCYQVAPGDF